jgi:16S rRNA (adenine1518-N6/adenine1519-N6)-dimethyltransferase
MKNTRALPFANKDLGQHFLSDSVVISHIVHDYQRLLSSHPFDFIIEVGPGPGVLTKDLAQLSFPLMLVEKDERFREYLAPLVPNEQLLITDALKLDWSNFSRFLPPSLNDNKTCWLVSNLPYNVGTPLMRFFLTNPLITSMTLMMQKEVAEKIIPPAHQKNTTNSLMCLMQNYFEVLPLCHVPPHAFKPPPKVDSMVLTFKRRPQPLVSLSEVDRYEKFLRLSFGQKRKQLIGLLKGTYPLECLKSFLTRENLNEQLRAETLTLEQVISLYKHLQ